jgi:hypothetical protein
MEMLDSLPLGPARLNRPASVFRYTFEHFAHWLPRNAAGFPASDRLSVVPVEAVAEGDVQVLAAREQGKERTPIVDLDALAGFPAVESLIASTHVRATRPLPGIREVLLSSGAPFPDAATLRHLTGLDSLYALPTHGNARLALDALPGGQMRKLALTRWLTMSLAPLEKMTGLEQLSMDLFREPLDPVAGMPNLKYLRVRGPAKGWAKLRECTQLEEASLIDVEIANLRRWNTWNRLRIFILAGRGVKSLAGFETFQQLEQLTLLNLRMDDLSPLRELPRLSALTLRMPARGVDLTSVAAVPQLKSLVIDDAAITDGEVMRVPTLKPLAKASALQDLTLICGVADGDLTPLMELPQLRKLRLGPSIGANVETLRSARPDMLIDYTPLDPKWEKLKERVGEITIQRPGQGLKQWSIFQSLALNLNLATNYAAESRIKKEIKKRDPELAKRLSWDTEAGAVAVYADSEADIRAVAHIANDLLRAAAEREGG